MIGIRSQPRAWLALAMVAALLISCTGAPASPSTSATNASTASTSTYGQIFAQVHADGSVDKSTALQAFSLAISPLPGVQLPAGTPPAPYERASGTFAILWLLRYYDQLTRDQKSVVDATLAPQPGRFVVGPTAGVTARLVAARIAGPVAQPYLDALSQAKTLIAGKLGRQLAWRGTSIPFSLTLNPTQMIGDALAYAVPVYTSVNGSQQLAECAIHVEPSLGSSSYDATERQVTMAHEMFHCFQYALLGPALETRTDWLIEGQAEWAGELALGPSAIGTGWWATYLSTPLVPLFGRTYDAVGFYQHMAELGIDPWTHFDAMLLAPDSITAFRDADANSDAFLDTWPSGLFREASVGPAWNAQGPWQTNARHPMTVTIATGHTYPIVLSAVLKNLPIWIISQADLIETKINGHARLGAAGLDIVGLADRLICTRSGGCAGACPPKTEYSGPPYETTQDNVLEVAVTSGLNGASGSITGLALAPFCKPAPSSASGGPPCSSGCAGSAGDPHLTTVDGTAYDFQGGGEFVLLRSPDSSVEIQARQEPLAGINPTDQVTDNTALVARVNGHRVQVDLGASGLALRVDGNPVDASAPIDLGAGGRVADYGSGVEIDFPDGTALWAFASIFRSIEIEIRPSAPLRADGVGILGRVTFGGMGVPALPDGTVLPRVSDPHLHYVQLYQRFAYAWRVTDTTSLFDYAAGQSTATFTKVGFPSEQAVTVLAALGAAQTAGGQAACVGIADPSLRQDCTFDVAVSGDPGFAQQYQLTQTFLANGSTALGLPAPSGTPALPGGSGAGTLDACNLISPSELGAIIGQSVRPGDETTGGTPGVFVSSGCVWGGGTSSVSLDVSRYTTAKDAQNDFAYQLQLAGPSTPSVPGIGDAAFVNSYPFLWAVKGAVVLDCYILVLGAVPQATMAQEERVAALVAARL